MINAAMSAIEVDVGRLMDLRDLKCHIAAWPCIMEPLAAGNQKALHMDATLRLR